MNVAKENKLEYQCWCAMKQRCYNPKTKFYNLYGGRGITVCEAWKSSFKTFLADMGNRPSARHSIDRINNDGNYEPGNCRWATQKEQCNNKRWPGMIESNGIRKTAKAWGRDFNTDGATIRRRLSKGLPMDHKRVRVPPPAGRGELNPNAKLSEADVVVIKEMLKTNPIVVVAKMFSVKHALVSKIKTGRSWKHI